MSLTTPISTALLAYGMSGKLFQAPFLAAHAGFQLQAVVERTEKRMHHDYPGIVSYGSVAEVLADPAIELVVVNTPSDTHVELAKQALAAGKHVLLEKPVATSVAQLDELLALAQAHNRHLLAYQNRRWDTDFGAVRRVVESGQLGQLIEVQLRYDRYKPLLHTKAFKETAARPGSGLVFDLGPHVLDQAISLFGAPLRVDKTVGHYRPGTQVDDYFHLHLHYPNGLNVWVASGLLIADPVPAYVLHGTLGSYHKHRTDPQEAQLLAGLKPTDPAFGHERPDQAGRLTLAAPDGTLTTAPDPAAPGNYRGLFEAVYQTIRHGAEYPVRPDHLRAQVAILAG